MNPWIPIAITIVINVAALVFALGKMTQKVDGLKERMGVSDEAVIRSEDKAEKWKNRVEKQSLVHEILPACMEEFKEINRQLGQLQGSMNTLIELKKGGK